MDLLISFPSSLNYNDFGGILFATLGETLSKQYALSSGIRYLVKFCELLPPTVTSKAAPLILIAIGLS